MDLMARITIDPDQCGGKPCIRGMRIRVIDILDLLGASVSAEQIIEELPYVEREDIVASLQYAARLMLNVRGNAEGTLRLEAPGSENYDPRGL